MPESTVFKLPDLVIFGAPLHTFQISTVSAAIFHENIKTGNIWPRVFGQLCERDQQKWTETELIGHKLTKAGTSDGNGDLRTEMNGNGH